MSTAFTSQQVTTGDLARELNDSPKRVAAVIYSRNIKEAGRVGNARVFNRDEVLPLIRPALERSRQRREATPA